MKKFYTLLSVSLFLFGSSAFAQLSGTYTINNLQPTSGTNFNSFADAFTALNTQGVSGSGATFLVSVGQTFNEHPPVLMASGTAAAPITFTKSAAGANPKVIPSVVGTLVALPGNPVVDGVIRISGGDFITFNGIDIGWNPTYTSALLQYEVGYYLFRSSPTDACRNISIINCSVDLDTVYGQYGIYSTYYNTSGSPVFPTHMSGRVEHLKFANNVITAPGGIKHEGYTPGSSDPSTIVDHYIAIDSNEIILHAATIAGGSGIAVHQADSVQITFNTIETISATTSGGGVLVSSPRTSKVLISNNDVSISSAGGLAISVSASSTGSIATIADNDIHDCVVTLSTPPQDFVGIFFLGAAFADIRNNSIYNIQGAASINAIETSASGIVNVYQNQVYDLTSSSNINPFELGGGGSGQHRLFANVVHGITSTGMSTVSGTPNIAIRMNAVNLFCYNNFVSGLYAPHSINQDAIRAFWSVASLNQNFFYNTVYLDASSSSSTSFGTTCLYLPGAAAAEVRNNILVNVSVHGPVSGYSAAMRMSNTTLNLSNNSNNNCLFAGTGANNVLFYDGSTYDATINDYHNRMGAVRESNSFSAMPPFLNVTTAPYDLHIDATVTPNPLNDAATPVTSPLSITGDIDGNGRSASTPDVGADEFSIPLPLHLLSFNATKKGGAAVLIWNIEENEDNSHYVVEASVNGVLFKEIGEVKASGTAGYMSYEYVHATARSFAGNGKAVYYRLKLVDVQRAVKYSRTERISFEGDAREQVVVYPNPVVSQFFVKLPGSATINFEYSVVDIKGNVVAARSGTLPGGAVLSEDALKSAPAGLYLLNISLNGEKQQMALVRK